MQLIFPQFYFHYHFDGHKELKNNLLSKYLKGNNFKVVDSWKCNSKTFNLKDLSEIQVLFSEIFEKFSSEINQNIEIFVENAWINLYEKGDFQEIHHHLPKNTFSMVYFLEYEKNVDSDFYFYNTNSSSLLSSNLNTIFDDNLIGDNWTPNVREGDVIIFPSYLHHGVKPQIANKKRITMSCNFVHNVVK